MRLLFLLFALINVYPGVAQNDCYGLGNRAIALEQISVNEAIWSGILRTHREDGHVDIHLFDEGKETIIPDKEGGSISISENRQFFTVTDFYFKKGMYQVRLYDYKNRLISTFETIELGSFEGFDEIHPMNDGITILQKGDMSDVNCLMLNIIKVADSLKVETTSVNISNKYCNPRYVFSSDFNDIILSYSLESKIDRVIYLTYFESIDIKTNTRKWLTSAKLNVHSDLAISEDDNTIMFCYSLPSKANTLPVSKNIGVIDDEKFYPLSEVNTIGDYECRFIKDKNRRYAFTWGGDNAYLYDINTKRLIWDKALKNGERISDAVLCDEQIILLSFDVTKIRSNPKADTMTDYFISQVDFKGNSISRTGFKDSVFSYFLFGKDRNGKITLSSFKGNLSDCYNSKFKNFKLGLVK